MDNEIIFALVVIVVAMAVSGIVLRKQWADYCARIFMKRSHKSGRRSSKTHA